MKRRSSAAAALVALVALAASVAGLFNDFVYDDIPLILNNDRVHSLAHWREIVANAYWPPPFVEQLYRPLTVLVLAIEYTVGGGSPLAFRIVSYALYGISAVCVLRLAMRLLPERAAIAVAVLFAAHPVHVEAVALGVNQAELLVGVLGVTMVARYIDARRRGLVTVKDWAILAGLYAAATFVKENGFVLPGLLLAAELVLFTDGSPARRMAALWRGYATLAGVAAASLIARTVVLSGAPVEVVTTNALAGLDAGGRLLAMLQVIPTWFRLLSWPAHLQADYVANEIAAPGAGLRQAVGSALVCATAVVAWFARRRAPVACFGVLWWVIALLPVSNIVPTGILLAERTLFLPSVGFLLAVAALADYAVARRPAVGVRRALVVACATLMLLGIARSVGRHRVWNTAHLKIVTRTPS